MLAFLLQLQICISRPLCKQVLLIAGAGSPSGWLLICNELRIRQTAEWKEAGAWLGKLLFRRSSYRQAWPAESTRSWQGSELMVQ
jgi:hypothetical protein